MANVTLSYVGTVETTEPTPGNVLMQITFPSSIKALMFEYKYQPDGLDIVDPTDIITGFIYPDAAGVSQISNAGNSSYLLPLPVPDGETTYNVAVRVYNIIINASYTNWSNALTVYRPPMQPLISNAYFDIGDYNIGLPTRIYVDLSSNTIDINNPDIRYIASYYYVKNGTNVTAWETTGILELDVIDGVTQPTLTFQAKGQVSVDLAILYIAVNAVLPFVNSGTTFYSVSEISNTATATQAEITNPVMVSVDYNVDQNGGQQMVPTWSPPSSSFIPDLYVDHYVLEVNIYLTGTAPGDNWVVVDNNIPPNGTGQDVSYNYIIDVNTYPSVNPDIYTFDFRVKAVLLSGTVTGYSNTLGNTQINIESPQFTGITYNIYDTNQQDLNNYNTNPGAQTIDLTWVPAYNSKWPLIDGGFTASNYIINVTITGDGTTVNESITLPGTDLSYTYSIASQYVDTIVYNISFAVYAVLESPYGGNPNGGVIYTAESDPVSKNTFTYATAPDTLYLNWAVPDTSGSGIDVSFTFTNTLYPGLGYQAAPNNANYLWLIYNSNDQSDIVQQKTEAYNPSTPIYNILANFTPADGIDYKVKVLLQTKDTNSSDILNGLNATTGTITPTTVPFIYDIVVTPDPDVDPVGPYSVSFKIASNVILAPRAVLLYGSSAGNPENPVLYNTDSVTPVRDLENWIYTYDGANSLSIPESFAGFAITAANQAGIGFRIFPEPA